MSLILQIETATTSCSIALAKHGQVLGFKEINQRNIHAEVITLFIEALINAAGHTYNDIDAVAVSSGPGSYTGLRIGVSTAKGLCFALDKPLIAIETLTAMARGATATSLAGDCNMLLCPMIDARRMEVYTAVFNATGGRISDTAAEIIDGDSFNELLKNNKMLFFGDGADKCQAALGGNPNARFLPGFINSATFMTQIAAQKFIAKDFVDVAYFEPFYLKEFIAGKKAL
ncbi:tRNA (adenosine(37)-N6)-threonylcarbamoyltransferase complex dimerization subunit type 1 TsaB [soil metagenome]|jgi:tRNA threonylcarbamoyladenosine biosynthesis protein TsaB